LPSLKTPQCHDTRSARARRNACFQAEAAPVPCTLRWDREREFAEIADGVPDGPDTVQIPARWGQPVSAQDVRIRASLRGATLLFPQPDAIKRIAAHDVVGLSRLGVSRFVFFRPVRHGRTPISFESTASTPVAWLRHVAVLWQTRLAFYIAGLTHVALRIARSTGMAFRIARCAYRTIAGRPSHSFFMKTWPEPVQPKASSSVISGNPVTSHCITMRPPACRATMVLSGRRLRSTK
jgi:hypothetical protein